MLLLLGLGSFFVLKAKAVDYGSDDLLKTAHQRIGTEFAMVDTFWTNTMIPVAVCLAVVLLIISIFAVSLIAIRALNEPEPAFSTFAPPGFDALWERNIQAELGMSGDMIRKVPLETILEEEQDDMIEVKAPIIKFPELPVKESKKMQMNIPSEPPKPKLATNSKTGLEINE